MHGLFGQISGVAVKRNRREIRETCVFAFRNMQFQLFTFLICCKQTTPRLNFQFYLVTTWSLPKRCKSNHQAHPTMHTVYWRRILTLMTVTMCIYVWNYLLHILIELFIQYIYIYIYIYICISMPVTFFICNTWKSWISTKLHQPKTHPSMLSLQVSQQVSRGETLRINEMPSQRDTSSHVWIISWDYVQLIQDRSAFVKILQVCWMVWFMLTNCSFVQFFFVFPWLFLLSLWI